MLQPKCSTCKTQLSNKQLIYERMLTDICNSNLTDEEKNNEKMKLLDTLQVLKICCRTKIMTYVKLIDIIV